MVEMFPTPKQTFNAGAVNWRSLSRRPLQPEEVVWHMR
jgi:hypothetical protein